MATSLLQLPVALSFAGGQTWWVAVGLAAVSVTVLVCLLLKSSTEVFVPPAPGSTQSGLTATLSAGAAHRPTARPRSASASGSRRERNARRSPSATGSARPSGTSAMMQPPKPPPVIRAPSAPASLAASTARSTVGTVISKSSRMEACEASSSGRQVGQPAGDEQLGRLGDPGVLGDHVADPPPHHLVGQRRQGGVEVGRRRAAPAHPAARPPPRRWPAGRRTRCRPGRAGCWCPKRAVPARPRPDRPAPAGSRSCGSRRTGRAPRRTASRRPDPSARSVPRRTRSRSGGPAWPGRAARPAGH